MYLSQLILLKGTILFKKSINFFSTTYVTMKNPFSDYLKLLDTFTHEEKINDLNTRINKFATDKHIANIKGNRSERIKELKHIKNTSL